MGPLPMRVDETFCRTRASASRRLDMTLKMVRAIIFKLVQMNRPKHSNATFAHIKLPQLTFFVAVAHISVGQAQAQVGETLLLPPLVPPGFDRGHNQSVTELPRPAFDPVGVRLGSFELTSSLASGIGVTSNTYFTAEPVASAFSTTAPSAQIASRWSRHELVLSGTGTFREYLGQSRRNETTWQASARGRINLGNFTTINIQEISAQLSENQFSGEATPTIAALSRYRRDFLSARALNQQGRFRFSLGTDVAFFRFQPLPLLGGGTRDQGNRNREVTRVTGQVEYAQTPSLAFFTQASFAKQSFDTVLRTGVPNVDANGYRISGGVDVDASGFARGMLAVGYTNQNFEASIYQRAEGVSVQARLEMFPSRLTTVTFDLGRTIEVTNLGVGGTAYWSNQVSARVDREIWRSILINLTASYSKQTYLNSGTSSTAFQTGFGAQYLSSRHVVVDAAVNYGRRSANSIALGDRFDEVRTNLALTYRL